MTKHNPVFWVVRNPRDPAQALVSWDTVDTRTQAVVNSSGVKETAVADSVTRNKTLNPLGG